MLEEVKKRHQNRETFIRFVSATRSRASSRRANGSTYESTLMSYRGARGSRRRIGWTDIRESRVPLEKSTGKPLIARDCRGRSTYSSAIARGLVRRPCTRTSSRSAIQSPGRLTVARLSVKLIHRGHRVLFTDGSLLVQELLMAKRELRLARLLKRLAKSLPSSDPRRHRLRAARSRGDGGSVHPVGRALRARQHHPHEQSAVLEMGENLQRPHDDGRGDRPARAPQHHPGAQRCELSTRAIEEEQGESGQDQKTGKRQ